MVVYYHVAKKYVKLSSRKGRYESSFFFNIYLFIWLRRVLVTARRLFLAALGLL